MSTLAFFCGLRVFTVCGVRAEQGQKIALAVVAQFGAVTDKQRFGNQSGVQTGVSKAAAMRVLPEPVASESNTRATWPACAAADDFFQRGPHGGVLIIPEKVPAFGVRQS